MNTFNEFTDLGDEIASEATEAIRLRDEMTDLGYQSKQIDCICLDLEQAIHIIKTSGIKGYIYMVDPKDTLAARFDIPAYKQGLSVESLKELTDTHISAAQEGLETYLTRFVELIKTIIAKLKSWCSSILSFRQFHLDYIRKHLERLVLLSNDTKVESAMKYKDADRLLTAIDKLHKYIRSIPSNPNTQVSQNGEMTKVLDDLCLIYEPGDHGLFYITNSDTTIPDRYKVNDVKTLSDLGWTPTTARDYARKLVAQEPKKEFDELIKTAEKHGKYVSEFQIDVIKMGNEPKGDSSSASLVRSHGSVVRMLHKFAIAEHQAVLHCCKTVRALLSIAPSEK